MKRVVVTGMGTVSPLGNDVASTWEGVIAGRSGVGPITRFDTTDFRTTIAAEARSFKAEDYFSARDARRMDPFCQFAIVAAREALLDAGLLDEAFTGGLAERTAVVIGSGIGGMSTVTEQLRVLSEKGPGKISPFFIPMILPESAASMVAIEHGLKGPNMAVTSACATGANAIGETARMIRDGRVDVAVAGGSEAAVIEVALAGFCALRAVSARNDDPQHASRPFDRDRDGFVMGEGAGILVLESLEHALARGATIHGEVLGYGSNDDAYHITAPDPDGAGATACMRLALASASLAFAALALEGAFRLAGVNVGTVQINRATVRRSDNPRLGFELRPGGSVHAEVDYRVNAEGLRGPETSVAKPPGVRRVAVLGDSIAFGYWVSDPDGFPRQLETMLNASGGAGER